MVWAVSPVNTDTEGSIESVLIKRVELRSEYKGILSLGTKQIVRIKRISVNGALTVIPGGDLSDMERAIAGPVGVLRPASGV